MVDEMAWDIGSSSEDGDDTLDDSNSNLHTVITHHTKPIPSARSSSRSCHEQSTPSSADVITKPSLETARRRSSSRAERSLSRSVLSTTRSTSARSRSGSNSRPPPRHISPSLAALNTSILGPTSDSFSHSSQFESALSLSPPTFSDRGRRSHKLQIPGPSRSPSPSVLPVTPVSMDRFVIPLEDDAVPAQPQCLERGRRPDRGPPPAGSYGDVDQKEAELDVLSETTPWSSNGDSKRAVFPTPAPLSAGRQARSNFHTHAVGSQGLDRDRRTRSSPPALASLWSIAGRLAWGESGGIPSLTPSNGSFCGTNSKSIPNPAKSVSRSKSVGYQRPGELHSVFATFLNG
jgi:hypothetical protein